MGALDEMLAKWRDNPDAGTTLALCTYLGTSRREDLIREVGSTAEAWHKGDAQVMLAIGRMYLDSALLQEAQAALVVAGKLSQADPSPYRYLGEVLLRRGDATRAEKVLSRALQIGGAEADTRMWHDRAVVYVALQTRVGMRAVADEIGRTIPKRMSIPPPTLGLEEGERPAPRAPQNVAPRIPPPPKLVSSMPPPLPPAPMPAFRSIEPSDGDIPTGRFDVPDAGGPSRDALATIVTPAAGHSGLPPPPSVPPPPFRAGPRFGAPSPNRSPLASSLPVALPPPVGPRSRNGHAAPTEFDDSAHPAAETVLEHLARVGVYERGGGSPPAWTAPTRARQRGTWFFATLITLAGAAGYGAFSYVRHLRLERMATARRMEAQVTRQLETGNLDNLRRTDAELSQVFDLDSRSKTAAILWLRNRVLSVLVLPGQSQGIESGLARCTTLGIDDARTAFGRIGSFLSEGDLAGAAAVLSKWDEKSKDDPFYHLVAAAMLERAGDNRAMGRYQQAFHLDPDLNIARLFHAELVTLELGPDAGRPFVEDVVKRLGDAPASHALVGLVWALDSNAGDLPDSGRVTDADRAKLPTQLAAIPGLVNARVAAREGHTDQATAALDLALSAVQTPALATTIGRMAIELGDIALARKATLTALSYSALYPGARSLAARVALLGGHIDEAKKAIQELDAKSPEVAVVRAAVAYESLDLSELDAAVQAMGSTDGAASALAVGSGIVLGRKYPTPAALGALAVPGVPWGDFVAVDAALDTGNMELAQKIAARWGDRASTPTYALRRSRLLRYEGKNADAALASADAVVPGEVTPRVLVERLYALLAARDVAGARAFLSQYPAVLGPMTDFLKVSTDVADDNSSRAKALAARLEPPPPDSPLLYDLIAARAFTEVSDRRAKSLVRALLRAAPKHPDVLAIAEMK